MIRQARRRRHARIALVALASAAAVAMASGIALATIPDSGGSIHGCYKKASPNQGTLRVIDTERGQTCANSENLLVWSETGPQGPQGLPGPQGPQGAQGQPGPAGITNIHPHVGTGYADSSQDPGYGEATAFCEPSEELIGGGFEFEHTNTLRLVKSRPVFLGDYWLVGAHGLQQPAGTYISAPFTAYAICADVGS